VFCGEVMLQFTLRKINSTTQLAMCIVDGLRNNYLSNMQNVEHISKQNEIIQDEGVEYYQMAM
jgi:hypothetical protein